MALEWALSCLCEVLGWGDPMVLEQTCSRLWDRGFEWRELAPLTEIDCPGDLTWITPLKQYDKLILSS